MSQQTTKTCSSEGCKRAYRAKSYCNYHYKKWRQGELPHGRYKICTQEGCRKKRHEASSSLCDEHYQAKFGKKEEAGASAAPAAAPEAAPAQ